MSRARTVKETSANVIALESTEDEGTQEWWDGKVEAVAEWLRLNPLRIGIEADETVETIQAQVSRGSQYPGTRIKCWKHIAVELESVAGSGAYEAAWNDHHAMMAQPLPEMPPLDAQGAPLAGSLRPGQLPRGGSAAEADEGAEAEGAAEAEPQQQQQQQQGERRHSESTAATNDATNDAEAGGLARSESAAAAVTAAEEDGGEDTSRTASSSSDRRPSSVVERSEEWQRRRAEKLQEAKRAKEEEEAKKLEKPPQRRMSAEYAGVQSKVAAHIAGDAEGASSRNESPSSGGQAAAARGNRRASVSTSTPSFMAGLKRNQPTEAKAKQPPKRRQSAAKKSGGKTGKTRRNTVTGPMSLLDQVRAELTAAATTEPEPVAEGNEDEEEDGDAAAAAPAAAEGEEADTFESAAPEVPQPEGGFAFDPSSTAEKGRFKLQDPQHFIMESIYRKRDAKAGCPGVSLLVGKREDPPHREQVISVIFDRSKFSEEQARDWWQLQKARFIVSV